MRVYILFAIAGLWVAGCEGTSPEMQEPSAAMPTQAIYRDLRARALDVRPDELGLSIPESSTTPYGVIVDMGLDGGTVTLVAFSTGDASMYTSTGGGVIGGATHDNVRRAAIRLVETAGRNLDSFRSDGPSALPTTGRALISVATNKGLLTTEDDSDELIGGSRPASPVFIAANDLITQLRLSTPES